MISIVLNSMVAGILFYTAYQFLYIGLRNRKFPEYMTFGFIVLLQAICALIELDEIASKNQLTYFIYRDSYYTITAVIFILFFFFISFFSGYHHQFLKWLYLTLVLLTLVFNDANSYIVFASHTPIMGIKVTRLSVDFVDFVFWIGNSLQFITLSIFSILAYHFQRANKKEYPNFIAYTLFFFIIGN